MNGTALKGLFRQIFALPAGLTERQQQLIRSSFERVLAIQETATVLFYERLFTLDPRLNALFKGDMNEQGRKLMTMISTVVDHSHCLGRLVPALLGGQVRQQAYTLAYMDGFMIIAWVCVGVIALIACLKPMKIFFDSQSSAPPG